MRWVGKVCGGLAFLGDGNEILVADALLIDHDPGITWPNRFATCVIPIP